MRKNEHAVALTSDLRTVPEERFAGALTLRPRNRTQVLLRADAGEPDADIAGEAGILAGTAATIRKRFAAEGLEAALTEGPCGGGPAVLGGEGEVAVIALARGPAPDGRAVRTAGMLANRLVESKVVERVPEGTVLRALKKARPGRGRGRVGAPRRG